MLPFTPEPQQQQYYDEDTFLDPSKNLITNMAPQSYTFGKIFNQPNSSRDYDEYESTTTKYEL